MLRNLIFSPVVPAVVPAVVAFGRFAVVPTILPNNEFAT
jgi:hypothetical protein